MCLKVWDYAGTRAFIVCLYFIGHYLILVDIGSVFKVFYMWDKTYTLYGKIYQAL